MSTSSPEVGTGAESGGEVLPLPDSRTRRRFEALRAAGERALVPYLTAGFPTKDDTLPLLHALERGGADIIELGVPFSDPIADGPTIQRASAVALDNGVTLPWVLEIVAEFRKTSQVPVVLFGAYNPFFHFGLDKLSQAMVKSGADGLLIADLPVDEAEEVVKVMRPANLDVILLVAPTTPQARRAEVAAHASGFIYYISLKGVTGARTDLDVELEQQVKSLKAVTDLPIAVGFGISTPEHASRVAKVADGVVVGSALIELLRTTPPGDDLAKAAENFIRSLKSASINA